MSNTVKLFIRYFFWAATLGIMYLIFVQSAKTATQSTEVSSSFISTTLSFLFKDFKGMSSEEQLIIVKTLTRFVRKLAHFTVYFCLGATSFSALCTYDLKRYTKMLSAFGISFCYAVSDEIHQILVPGRAGRIGDVLIDSAGTVCGIVLVIILLTIYKKIRKGKHESGKKDRTKEG